MTEQRHGWVTPRPDGTRENCGGPGRCAPCSHESLQAGFRGELSHLTQPTPEQLTCPSCGTRFTPDRLARATEAEDGDKPYGEVEYADPGYQADGKKRYPIDTAKHVKAAWSYISRPANAAKYKKGDLNRIRARIKRAARGFKIQLAEAAAEALINGQLSYSDVQELLGAALRERAQAAVGGYCWVWVVDLTGTEVVYQSDDTGLYQCSYTLSTGPDGKTTVTLGESVEVARTYAPLSASDTETEAVTEAVTEERAHILGRVIESKGNTAGGGRIFRVRVIAYGDSKNGRRYPESVLREAVALYEGAGAYDHHRDDAELRTSTIAGLVGHYRSVEATADGLEADLHLLPSAAHAAEALDASLAAQAEGLAPVVGISHDVMAEWRPLQIGGRRIQEATAIRKVNSVDIVASPAAGGQATRAVAGGIDPDPAGTPPAGDSTEEDSVTTTESVLAALTNATDEQLAAAGLRKATDTAPATEATKAPAAPAPEPDGELKTSFLGRLLIRSKVIDAGMPESAVESVAEALPERVTESAVDTHIAAIKTSLGLIERAGLTPQHAGAATVTQESLDKKVAALDAFFAADYRKGYRSFREAFIDITGRRPKGFDEDFNRTMLKESMCAGGFESARRSTESLTTSSWDAILGDSITRRMGAEYGRPNLQTWQLIVSSIVPVNDFRTQRIDRLGGYGVLPAVNQGAPYQPLTSPGDEEATYAITKRGGTEDLTLEMLANDDIRSIQRIPIKLGLAAAQTLYRYVWDILVTNAATTYDATALFHANHGNTDNPAVLGQSTLATGRRKMRQQAAYGDSSDVLSIIPRTLIVPSALEEIGYQLVTSAVAIPSTPAGPSDTPNLHQGMQMVVIDYYADTNDWFLAADTGECPTIEMGFYQGKQEPELFTQSDPQMGSMFDADKITWKLRHIYSGAVLDHRGFYRGAN
ncbi:phage major capsid protein [Crossiella sp. CA198]|uniref:phage major capsid protein n=1 Tax=Crossiella sp. CA198 TaxID=3455607 RepID=UPI003F8D453E